MVNTEGMRNGGYQIMSEVENDTQQDLMKHLRCKVFSFFFRVSTGQLVIAVETQHPSC